MVFHMIINLAHSAVVHRNHAILRRIISALPPLPKEVYVNTEAEKDRCVEYTYLNEKSMKICILFFDEIKRDVFSP